MKRIQNFISKRISSDCGQKAGDPVTEDRNHEFSLLERLNRDLSGEFMLCHRIDRNTGGIVVLSKKKEYADTI